MSLVSFPAAASTIAGLAVKPRVIHGCAGHGCTGPGGSAPGAITSDDFRSRVTGVGMRKPGRRA
jgi:hypothetical protein